MTLDKEINAGIFKVSQSLGRLRSRELNQYIKQFNKPVLTSLLYGYEVWTLYRWHIKLLEHFYMRSLRFILGNKWQDRVTNREALDHAEIPNIDSESRTQMDEACHPAGQ